MLKSIAHMDEKWAKSFGEKTIEVEGLPPDHGPQVGAMNLKA
jgi:hypothetical protein